MEDRADLYGETGLGDGDLTERGLTQAAGKASAVKALMKKILGNGARPVSALELVRQAGQFAPVDWARSFSSLTPRKSQSGQTSSDPDSRLCQGWRTPEITWLEERSLKIFDAAQLCWGTRGKRPIDRTKLGGTSTAGARELGLARTRAPARSTLQIGLKTTGTDPQLSQTRKV